MSDKTWKIMTLVIAALLLFFTLTVGSRVCIAQTVPANKANVVLIVIDTLRADHLPMYGYNRDTAPFLSEFAQHSTIFANAYAASSWTPPSTVSILTSLMPFQHGVLQGMLVFRKQKESNPHITLNRIPQEAETIAEMFRSAGYKTFAITDNINICKEEGMDQGFDVFFNYNYKTAPVVARKLLDIKPQIDAATHYFLYLHFNDPHQPLNERFPWYQPQKDTIENLKAQYDSEIHYLDTYIEHLFLQFGWGSNTVVIVTADHGEEFEDHGRYGHGYSLYDEVTHVPLWFFFPARKNLGCVEALPVSNMDIMPTLRAWLGIPPHPDHQGQNLLPVIRKEKPLSPERSIFSYLFIESDDGIEITVETMLQGKWKVHTFIPQDKRLFNMDEDPREKSNLSKIEPQLFQKLKEQLVSYKQSCKTYTNESVDHELSQEKLDSMQQLGYVR